MNILQLGKKRQLFHLKVKDNEMVCSQYLVQEQDEASYIVIQCAGPQVH